MITKTFKDISLPRLGMGCMRLPVIGEGREAPVDKEHAKMMIDYCMKNGLNYFDTAYPYHSGESERFLGEAMKQYPRDSFYLATKYFLLANSDYKAVFEEQLSRLQTDHVDFYMIHGIFDNTWKRYIDEGAVAYFIEQKEKGRIKYLGFSSHASPENLTTFADHHKWDFCQIQLNYYDWHYGSAKQEYDILNSRNIPIIAMEPVRGGRLASLSPEADAILKAARPNESVASWALRWVANLDGVQIVLSGMSNIDQLKENIALFQNEISFTDADAELIQKACEAFRSSVVVPCTKCRYCIENDSCPAKIDIPAILEIYNRFKTDGMFALHGLASIEPKPTACTGCGTCNERCPQGINIKSIMQELGEMQRRMPR